ncbi:MAG: UDP-glucose 4-epimerase GalE, partial [Cyanobacteriota bacterium]
LLGLRWVARASQRQKPEEGSSGVTPAVFNLGNGKGYSVRQVIQTAEAVTGRLVPTRVAPRRPGDPPVLLASADRARQELGWRPRHPELEVILAHAWAWHQRLHGELA